MSKNIEKYKQYTFELPKEDELPFKIEIIKYKDLYAICEQVLNGVAIDIAFISIGKEFEYSLIRNDANWFPESNTAKMFRFIRMYRGKALASTLRNLHRIACSSNSQAAIQAGRMLLEYEQVVRMRDKPKEIV